MSHVTFCEICANDDILFVLLQTFFIQQALLVFVYDVGQYQHTEGLQVLIISGGVWQELLDQPALPELSPVGWNLRQVVKDAERGLYQEQHILRNKVK